MVSPSYVGAEAIVKCAECGKTKTVTEEAIKESDDDTVRAVCHRCDSDRPNYRSNHIVLFDGDKPVQRLNDQ